MIQSICLSLGLAVDQPDARDKNSRLNRALSFMSPARNSGVLGSAACSCRSASASARTAASRIASRAADGVGRVVGVEHPDRPEARVEVNRTSGTWIIGPPYLIET